MPPRSTFLLAAALAVWLIGLSAGTPGQPAAGAKSDPSFAKEGVAFVAKHCARCHGDKVKKGDLRLTIYQNEADVLKHRKVWQNVLTVLRAGDMPPPSVKARPAATEVDAFTSSIQAIFDRADRNAKPDPGRVTIRRLNRTEYNNTIRDLVGVDFQPAEDFPDDDVGHGFDNIGDVLSLPPLLMERYLAAAEGIVGRAILGKVPKPPQRRIPARFLQPRIRNQARTTNAPRWRPLDERRHYLSVQHRVSLAGEFFFRVHAWARQIDDHEPVRVAILDGQSELKRFDVTASEKQPVTLEIKLDLSPGDHRFYVKILNPTAGEKGRNLMVEFFQIVGPSDTRPASHRKLLATTGKTTREQTTEVLARFASKAFRRPATDDEVGRLVKLAETAQKRGDTWEESIQLPMQAVLVSPKFLFRVELDDGGRALSSQGAGHAPRSPEPINEYQLASRLSYFLWSTMPDDELFALAAKKQLTANLDAQVQRMLKDSKASALVDNFAMQWLQLRRLQMVSPDTRLFPTFNEALRKSMLKETELFFTEIIREDHSILDLIDGGYTYLDERLATHYGIMDTAGTRQGQPRNRNARRILTSRFLRVELPAGDDRRGILGQASILTVTSNPTRTSPVKRGKWVLEQLLGTPPPPPPPDVPELAENDKAVLTGSLRQRMEQHRKNPTCANCHAKMDPLGFAFENYDAVGRYRTLDGKFPIDPAGVLPDGKSFKGPAELKAILKEKKDLFARCLAEKMLTYALGRGVEYYDRPAIDGITAALAKNEYRFSALVREIAKSYPFRMRRGKETSP
jgi:hypothetical protein